MIESRVGVLEASQLACRSSLGLPARQVPMAVAKYPRTANSSRDEPVVNGHGTQASHSNSHPILKQIRTNLGPTKIEFPVAKEGMRELKKRKPERELLSLYQDLVKASSQ